MWGAHNISTSWKVIDWLTNTFQHWWLMYHTMRQMHLASKQDKTNHQRHLQALFNPGVLCIPKSKMMAERCCQVCRQGFRWIELRLDKRAWHSQDYSVCRRLEQRVLWIYCMFRAELFVSTPPTTSCFQVRQNGKSFARKTSSTHQTLWETIPGSKSRLMRSHFWKFFQVFLLHSNRTRVRKETLSSRAIPSNTIPFWMEVISSMVVLYASTVTTGLKLYSVSKWWLFCRQAL